MPFTFAEDWNASGNHITTVLGLVTGDDVQGVVSSACAGRNSSDNLTRSLLTLCAAADSQAIILKGVHQAEGVSLIDATYHVTVRIPCGNGSVTFHVYFSLTVIAKGKPKDMSNKKWRKVPAADREYRKFSLVKISYIWNGARQTPAFS